MSEFPQGTTKALPAPNPETEADSGIQKELTKAAASIESRIAADLEALVASISADPEPRAGTPAGNATAKDDPEAEPKPVAESHQPVTDLPEMPDRPPLAERLAPAVSAGKAGAAFAARQTVRFYRAASPRARKAMSTIADWLRSEREAPADRAEVDIRQSIRKHLMVGAIAALALVVGIGGWSAFTYLSGAVIAGGHMVVDSSVKTVQHPSGGVVKELMVSEGDAVEAGKVLIRLDDTTVRANLGIVSNTLDELQAARARLLAERDGLAEVAFPPELSGRAGDQRIAGLIAGEKRLFTLRNEAHDGLKSQLSERISQLNEEIRGLTAQEEAKAEEIRIVATEVEGVRELWKKKLVPIARLSELERTAARLKGERGQLIAAISQARGRITETELQVIQLDQNRRSKVAEELAEIEAKSAEFGERLVAAQDQLNRIEIRAPQTGRVLQLAVHTIGGVISAGEPIMKIVPDSEDLSVEARISPHDIDQLYPGQPAMLRFSALNHRNTPEVHATITRISPDLIEDKASGFTYYEARLALDDGETERLGDVDLVPGMPVETFIRTSDRTVLSFLLKPLTDQVARAFREE
ncbi:HlyD family type I secretion periplasmic adaptor subunit [Stappia albiluteola]|nr:HlyD family type I secretion periplasmic adaptor subunit [Stappia albiluteola]